jgi:hypothetical protein
MTIELLFTYKNDNKYSLQIMEHMLNLYNDHNNKLLYKLVRVLGLLNIKSEMLNMVVNKGFIIDNDKLFNWLNIFIYNTDMVHFVLNMVINQKNIKYYTNTKYMTK